MPLILRPNEGGVPKNKTKICLKYLNIFSFLREQFHLVENTKTFHL